MKDMDCVNLQRVCRVNGRSYFSPATVKLPLTHIHRGRLGIEKQTGLALDPSSPVLEEDEQETVDVDMGDVANNAE